jgi:cephalosporin-C deacetylase-like acetyl esterase
MSENSYIIKNNEASIENNIQLKILLPKNPPLYQIGDTVNFEIELTNNGKKINHGILNYKIMWDNAETLLEGKANLSEKPSVISFFGTKMGFVQLFVSYEFNGKKLETGCGAGFSVADLKPSMETPPDFHEFWQSKKQLLEKIPLKSKWVSITHTSHPDLHQYSQKTFLEHDISEVDVFYVTVDCLGNPVEGVLTMPKNRKIKNCPVVLAVHGAGVVPSQPHNFLSHAKKGAIIFEINAHGLPNTMQENFYNDLFAKELFEYKKFGSNNRDEFYFLKMYLRVVRGLEFLKSLPEWDGKRLFIRGSSQGGAQSIAGAYLDQDVTGFIATVPGLCDTTAAVIERVPGWPSLAPYDKNKRPDPKIIECLRYFDSVNFLKNTKAEGFFSVSLLDDVCKPTSIYVAYNAHQGKHSMIHQPYSGHTNLDETNIKSYEFMWQHFKDIKAV